MSSDDAYSSFLDQANQDTGSSKVSLNSKTATTKVVDTDVPVELQNVEQYYTSEADEPFEPVSLKWDGKNMPSESTSRPVDYSRLILCANMGHRTDEFADLIAHDLEVSTLSTKDFDPRSQYKDVFQAVEKAGDGKSRIYRVGFGKTRIKYYVVGLDKENRRVVGLKAEAVES